MLNPWGSNWPNITMERLNLDFIFQELIPKIKELKQSYDNIQDIVRQETQANYTAWRAELTRELNALSTQLTQDSRTWQQQFEASNTVWRDNAQKQLARDFASWQQSTEQALEAWQHSTKNELTQLINSFTEDISEAEARAKKYADDLHSEQMVYIQQQIRQLSDALQHQLNELQQQINNLTRTLNEMQQALQLWRSEIIDTINHHKQDVELRISEFEEEVARQLAAINQNLNEQLALINQRISNLTASDIDAIDPMTGETENIQSVLRHMFDVFSEYNGCITAGEYKQLEITAGEYKEKYNYPAILYSVASYWLLKIRKWERPAVYYNGEYVTPAELERRLMDYITKAAVDAELADYALTNDVDQKLAQYIKTKDMISYLATTLENYVTYDSLQNTLQDYARPEDLQQLQAELNQKATQEQLESLRQAVYNEFDNYAKVSELPDFSEFLKSSEAADIFATLDDLNKYALKTELPDVSGLLSKAEAADQYALKTELPDVSGLLSKAEAADQYALKTELPDVSGLLSKAEAAEQYALKTELPDVSGLLSKAEAADQYAPKETATALVETLNQHIEDANSKFALKSQLSNVKKYLVDITSTNNLSTKIILLNSDGEQRTIATTENNLIHPVGFNGSPSLQLEILAINDYILSMRLLTNSAAILFLGFNSIPAFGSDSRAPFVISIELPLNNNQLPTVVNNADKPIFPVGVTFLSDYGQPSPPFNILRSTINVQNSNCYIDVAFQYSGYASATSSPGGFPASIILGLWRVYQTTY